MGIERTFSFARKRERKILPIRVRKAKLKFRLKEIALEGAFWIQDWRKLASKQKPEADSLKAISNVRPLLCLLDVSFRQTNAVDCFIYLRKYENARSSLQPIQS